MTGNAEGERGPKLQAAPGFTIQSLLRAKQICSNTSRASAMESKDGCGSRPTLEPLPREDMLGPNETVPAPDASSDSATSVSV